MKAVAYYRTSSSTNVGEDKDSLRRQQLAIQEWADRNGYEIAASFSDMAVSGADPVMSRPGFSAMLDWLGSSDRSDVLAGEPVTFLGGQDCSTILVENASRFARDLAVQLTGHDLLKGLGIDLIPVDCPTHFTDDTPTATMIRQILGAVSEFERAQLVHRLKVARDRKRAETGRCGGRKPLAELKPTVVALVRRMKEQGASFRAISLNLAAQGFLNERGKPYDPRTLQRAL